MINYVCMYYKPLCIEYLQLWKIHTSLCPNSVSYSKAVKSLSHLLWDFHPPKSVRYRPRIHAKLLCQNAIYSASSNVLSGVDRYIQLSNIKVFIAPAWT